MERLLNGKRPGITVLLFALKSNHHKLSIGRFVGVAASVVLLISIFLPYVENASLAALIEPLLPGMFQVFSSPTLANFAMTASAVGFLLLVIGGIIGLVSFAALSKRGADLGMSAAVLGILLISVPVLEFQSATISKVFTVTGVVYWPTLKFFAFGYVVSWVAAIIGLVAARSRGRTERVVVIPPVVAPSTQPVVSRQMLTSEQAKGIKQVEPGRFATGYEALDSVLLGGIPEGASVVLTGVGSDERDRIVRRFIEATLNSGRGCIYLTTSIERVRDLLERHEKEFQVILCHPQAESIAGQLRNVRNVKSLEDLTSTNLAFEASRNTLASLEAKNPPTVCFEVLGDALLRHHGPTTRKWLMDLLSRAKSGKMTLLATFNPRMHSAEEAQTVEELFDGHIELHEEDVVTRGAKMIRVRKLGGQKFIEKDLLVEKDHI